MARLHRFVVRTASGFGVPVEAVSASAAMAVRTRAFHEAVAAGRIPLHQQRRERPVRVEHDEDCPRCQGEGGTDG